MIFFRLLRVAGHRRMANAFVADFIGSGNILPATALGNGQVSLPGGARLDVPNSGAPAAGAAIKMLVRPEDVRRSPHQAPEGNRLAGTVTFIRDIGATIETTVACGGVSLISLTTPNQGFGLGVGHLVSITLPAEACRVLGA